MNISLSPLNPISFNKKPDENSGEYQRIYVQQFLASDTIVLQLIGESGLKVIASIGDSSFIFVERKINNEAYSIYDLNIYARAIPKNELLDVVITAQFTPQQYIRFFSQDYIEIVEDCSSLKLIEYSNSSNISAFNTFFDNGNIKFQLRIPCGYKSTSVNQRLVSETFRNQNQELINLYSFPYQTKTLIIGDGLGVPNWMATLINYIFCLSDVTIDGEMVVRSDDSVPEIQGGIDGYPLHVYNMTVENRYKNLSFEIANINYEDDFSYDYV